MHWTRMTASIFPILLLLAIAPTGSHAATTPAPPVLLDANTPAFDHPDSVVARFLAAVDRGELLIFGRRLERAMIAPARVEYVFDLATRMTTLKIYSALKEPIPVPSQQGSHVWAVGVILDGSDIIETESHIWFKK